VSNILQFRTRDQLEFQQFRQVWLKRKLLVQLHAARDCEDRTHVINKYGPGTPEHGVYRKACESLGVTCID